MGITISIGMTLEVIGVCATAVGVWTTWRHFASPGESFLGPVIDPTRSAARALRARGEAWFRRVFKRPAPQIVGVGAATMKLQGMKARVRVGYGPLPADTVMALAELHRRTAELMKMLSEARERLEDDLDDVHEDIESLRAELGNAVARLDTRSQEAALDGLRTEAVGLFLVGLGVLLQGWTVTF